MEQLAKDGNYNEYLEPDVPFCFLFIFNTFLEIYSACGESITWTDIDSYAKIRKIDFKQAEIDLLLKMKSWSSSQIQKMRDEQE